LNCRSLGVVTELHISQFFTGGQTGYSRKVDVH
jgi:hypothetical protein